MYSFAVNAVSASVNSRFRVAGATVTAGAAGGVCASARSTHSTPKREHTKSAGIFAPVIGVFRSIRRDSKKSATAIPVSSHLIDPNKAIVLPQSPQLGFRMRCTEEPDFY